MGALESVTNIGNSVANRVSPGIDWVSTKLATFIDISPDNVHMLILLAIALTASSFVPGSNRTSIKYWVIGIGLFVLLRYFGF